MGKLRTIVGKLIEAALVVLGIATINFFLLQLAPGDAAEVLAGEAGSATPEYMAALRERFGLDQPVAVQFLHYIANILTLDLGYSFRQGMPVLSLILQRLPATLLLTLSGLCFAIGVGCAMGVAAARYKDRFPDLVISTVALIFYATPIFWIGLLLIVFGSVYLGLFPTGGIMTVSGTFTPLERALDVLWHLVLPMLTVGLFYLAIYARLMRASVLSVQEQDFVRTAVAKGVRRSRLLSRHIIRNALLPVVTMAGLHISAILGGAVLAETVFSWPGLGRLAVEALLQRDLNLLLGILLCSSVLVIVVNIIVDLVYRMLDPRIDLA